MEARVKDDVSKVRKSCQRRETPGNVPVCRLSRSERPQYGQARHYQTPGNSARRTADTARAAPRL